jgi:hypothetical protein
MFRYGIKILPDALPGSELGALERLSDDTLEFVKTVN